MAFRLCKNDPLTNQLHQVFKANIVRIPKAKVQPLVVIAQNGKELKMLGTLSQLLEGNPDLNLELKEGTFSPVADNKTNSMDFDFGFKVLEGFLKGFGLPSAGAEVAMQRAKEVSFAFESAKEFYVDTFALGDAVQNKVVKVTNPAFVGFLKKEGTKLLIVDGIIAANSFTLKIDKTRETRAGLDIDNIKNVLEIEKAKVELKSKNGREMTFQKDEYLTFAFTALEAEIDPATNTILSLGAGDKDLTFESSPQHAQISGEEAELLDF